MVSMNHCEHGLLQHSWASQRALEPIPILLPKPWAIRLCGCQLAQILYLSVPVSGLLVSSQGQIPKAVQYRAHLWPRRKLLSFCKRSEHELSILDNHSWTFACVTAPSLQIRCLAQTSQYLRLQGTDFLHRDHQVISDINNHNLVCRGSTLAKCQAPMKIARSSSLATDRQRREKKLKEGVMS